MEMPHLGQHCNEPSCKQLDFLPMKCDACDKIFCGQHIVYASHSCPESYRKDNQIPVCPLCNLPCPVKKGESPDGVVGRHIESDCQSDPAKSRRKVYSNRCSKKGCKQKELIPVKCDSCHQNFCLRHRHEQDHSCAGFQSSGKSVSNAGAAAIFRMQQKAPAKLRPSPSSSNHSSSSNGHRNQSQPRPQATSLQGTMTEDEALARALALSMNTTPSSGSADPTAGMTAQEREDFLLAQALSASEHETSNNSTSTRRSAEPPQRASDNKCLVQ